MSIPRELGATSRHGWPLTDRSAQHVCTYWVDGHVCTSALFIDLLPFPCFCRCCVSMHTSRRQSTSSVKSNTAYESAPSCTTLKMTQSRSTSHVWRMQEYHRVSQLMHHVRLLQPANSLTHSYTHTQVHWFAVTASPFPPLTMRATTQWMTLMWGRKLSCTAGPSRSQ